MCKPGMARPSRQQPELAWIVASSSLSKHFSVGTTRLAVPQADPRCEATSSWSRCFTCRLMVLMVGSSIISALISVKRISLNLS
jgi:hypothetical protein